MCYAATGQLLGWTGAVLIGASLATARKSLLAHILLAAGALPLAVVTWWSLVTPLLAVLTLVLGSATIRLVHRSQRATQSLPRLNSLLPNHTIGS